MGMSLSLGIGLANGGGASASAPPPFADAAYWYSSKDGSGATRANRGTESGVMTRNGFTTSTVGGRLTDVYDGSTDYADLPAGAVPTATASTGQHTIVVAFVSEAVQIARIYSSESAASNGLMISQENGNILVRMGGASTFANARAVGGATVDEVTVCAAVVDDGTIAAYEHDIGLSSTVSITGIGTITYETPKLARLAGAVAPYYDGGILEFIDYPGVAKTESELDDIATIIKANGYL